MAPIRRTNGCREGIPRKGAIRPSRSIRLLATFSLTDRLSHPQAKVPLSPTGKPVRHQHRRSGGSPGRPPSCCTVIKCNSVVNKHGLWSAVPSTIKPTHPRNLAGHDVRTPGKLQWSRSCSPLRSDVRTLGANSVRFITKRRTRSHARHQLELPGDRGWPNPVGAERPDCD